MTTTRGLWALASGMAFPIHHSALINHCAENSGHLGIPSQEGYVENGVLYWVVQPESPMGWGVRSLAEGTPPPSRCEGQGVGVGRRSSRAFDGSIPIRCTGHLRTAQRDGGSLRTGAPTPGELSMTTRPNLFPRRGGGGGRGYPRRKRWDPGGPTDLNKKPVPWSGGLGFVGDRSQPFFHSRTAPFDWLVGTCVLIFFGLSALRNLFC